MYKCTCHVYGQTHKYENAAAVKVPKTKPWLDKIQVHLSRLWTDTQVGNATVMEMSKTKPWLNKYECTCHVYGQTSTEQSILKQ